MNFNFIELEKPIAELEAKIEQLRLVGSDTELDINEEIKRLEEKSKELTRSIFNNLKPWDIIQIARHPKRPYTLDYIRHIFTDFDELHGDRHYSDDKAIVGGVARFNDEPVVIVGQQKARETKEKIMRNFGMPHPEGYRKALRLVQLAEKFNMPVFTFIDTQGAYPGVGAEERNQSEAIARNMFEMSRLRTPIINTVIGEGCSGGALGIGVGDRLLMLQYSYYSVISPEGCASILWRSADKAEVAAAEMKITAKELKNFGLIDVVVPEPCGGAHRDERLMADTLKQEFEKQLYQLRKLSMDDLLERRYQRLMSVGV